MNSIEKENNQSFELDMEVISDIKAERFLFCNDISHNSNYSTAYTGAFTWDIDKLSYALQNHNIENTDIIHFLNPQENISCDKVKTLVGSDPNTLVVAMTLLSNNYTWITEELRDNAYRIQNNKEAHSLSDPRYLFTKEEEVIFLTGRKLLVELNETVKSEYINNLIREVDDIICLFNEGLVGKYVRKYEHLVASPDLFQEGKCGILRALQDYDIEMGYRFSTYAGHWIRQRILRYGIYNRSDIRISSSMYLEIIKFKTIKRKLEEERQESITNEAAIEYCEENGIKLPSEKDIFLRAINQEYSIPLDEDFIDDEDNESKVLLKILSKSTGEVEDALSTSDLSLFLGEIINMASLTSKERFVLDLRWGLTPCHKEGSQGFHTFEAIANKLGITTRRVYKIEQNALKKLKETAQTKGVCPF